MENDFNGHISLGRISQYWGYISLDARLKEKIVYAVTRKKFKFIAGKCIVSIPNFIDKIVRQEKTAPIRQSRLERPSEVK